jgi:hypothetical protein
VRGGELGEGGQVAGGVTEHGFDSGELSAEHAGDDVELGAHAARVGLGEDSADRRGHHFGAALGHSGQQIAQEVHPAALPTGTEQHRANRGLQPGVRVGDDQCHPVQPAGLERAQEPGPKRAALAVPDVEPEDLAAAVGADPGGDHHGLGGHPGAAAAAVPADPGLAVGGIEEHIGEGDLGQ